MTLTDSFDTRNTYLAVSAFVLCILLTSVGDAMVHFGVDVKNFTTNTANIICRYGNSTEGHYFDIFRNGQQCLHAAFGACAPVVIQGCTCEEEMALNEARFMIELPHDYDTLKCKVLNGISQEKTINVTSKDEDQDHGAGQSLIYHPMVFVSAIILGLTLRNQVGP